MFKLLSMSIIKKLSNMNPPTIRIDIRESYTVSCSELCSCFDEYISLFNSTVCPRYNNPLINEDIILDIIMIMPALNDSKIPTPTVPTINIGPLTEHMLNSLYD